DRAPPPLRVTPQAPRPPARAGPPARPTAIHGFVRTPDGDPLEAASVTLMSKGGRQLDRVTSLADGSYIVSVPAPGAYLLAVTSSSYGSKARHVTVTEGPLVYDVELTGDEVDAVS
ncbi:carboxypeptidase-like regulatory domain-containing protein, partial [Streptomyces sp. NPDC059627]